MAIRRLTAQDADELAAVLLENRDFLAPFEPVRGERFFTAEGQREALENETSRVFGILVADRLAGTVAISNIASSHFQSGNLGYWVAQAFNDRGLATKAVGEVVDLAFTELGMHRLEAATLVDNVRSQRVLEKNDFELIGLARRYLRIAGAWRDHLLFQRTAD